MKNFLRRPPKNPVRHYVNTEPILWTLAGWTTALGWFMLFSPRSWFGPTWSYFPQLPHNGFGIGLCCIGLGTLQLMAMWRRWNEIHPRTLAFLLFLSGFVYWTSGIILGAEGLMGHQGLMEVPFTLYTGAHNLVHSAMVMSFDRQKRRRE